LSSIKIDRKFLKALKADAEHALASVATKYGVHISYKGGSFALDGGNATVKFEIVAPDAVTGKVVSMDAQGFAKNAVKYGLHPDDLGKEFTSRGHTYMITGLKTSRPKFPISASRVTDGKGFKFPADLVLRALGRQVSGLTPSIKESFVGLACDLSPENLCCDGEATRAQISRRRSDIMTKWAALEARAGRKVSEEDAWGWS
jgi:hypothetical protein